MYKAGVSPSQNDLRHVDTDSLILFQYSKDLTRTDASRDKTKERYRLNWLESMV